MYTARPCANGLSTDHPLPGLVFVDDTHLPLGESSRVKDVALRVGDFASDGQWWAYLPDPVRPALAWCVRHHPVHGRSVLLYPLSQAPAVLREWWGGALLHRAGGYWWDGATWHRPGQTWDPERADYRPCPVPEATTITAETYRAGRSAAATGRLHRAADIAADEPALAEHWPDDLALWASRHAETGGRPLNTCVVTLHAPELEASQLLGVPAVAATAGISPSTLRAYISRGHCDVPAPQAVAGRRSLWARPVVEEWAEQHRTVAEGPSPAPWARPASLPALRTPSTRFPASSSTSSGGAPRSASAGARATAPSTRSGRSPTRSAARSPRAWTTSSPSTPSQPRSPTPSSTR